MRLHSRDGNAPLRRRFAAEEWVKPEVDPPRISRCRAGLCRLSMTAKSEPPPALIETPPQQLRGSALFVKNLHSGDVLRQAPVWDNQAWIVALPRGEDGVPG